LLGSHNFPASRCRTRGRAGFSSDDLARLLPELQPHIRPVLRFAVITGWRLKSEILPLA
jgi:hypothetical protein